MARLREAIDLDGAVVRVRIEIGMADEAYLTGSKLAIPKSYITTALLDTGASCTAVDPIVIGQLGLQPRGFLPVLAPRQTKSGIVLLYDIRLTIGYPAFKRPRLAVQVVGVAPATPTVSVLIGRDILDRCTLLYDGPGKTFTLWL